jgi:alpha-L-arabinofuranosidase
MKAANPNALVGVVVNPGNSPAWDPIVLSQAKYDFVEYHYYAQAPGSESDTYLVQQAAQAFASALNSVKADLASAGKPNTAIYVGELGSVYSNPGKQTSSITQALFAGQVLGELMNAGISRATWWIGFGGCSDASGGNFSSSLYGWQNFGGYMVFSDGTPEYGCTGATAVPVGTLLPTARAYQLFSSVALNGESVLSANVSGDTTDVRAYAATNNGGTALVLFNLNETASQSVAVALSSQTASSQITVETYSKAIYDQSQNNVWAAPTTANLGAQNLPLTLTLAPWSMNVVILK